MSSYGEDAGRSALPVDAHEVPSGEIEVALLDGAGVIVGVNGAWESFCRANGGNPARAGVGTSYLAACDAVDDRHARQVGQAIRRAVCGGLPAPMRVEIPCDGPHESRWFDVQVASRFDDGGACLGAIVTLSPCSPSALTSTAAERRRPDRPGGTPAPLGGPEPSGSAMPALSQDEAVPLLEAAPDGLVVVDSVGRILHVNRQLEQLSGYARAELVSRSIEVLVPGESRERHGGLRARYAADPRMRLMGEGAALRLRRRDGSTLPVEISLGPTSIDGHPVVLAAVRDVTTRQELEDRLRLVADLFDAMTDAVVVIETATGLRVYANQAVLDRTGYTREELNAVPVGAPSNPEERVGIQEAIAAVVSGRVRETALDTHVLSRSGATVPVELRITHRPPPAGSLGAGHVILVARDISERLAAQERLRASEESFRTAFERAPIGMVITTLDAEGHRRIARANAALADILGVPANELVGCDFADFTYPEDEQQDHAAAVRMAGRRQHRYERQKRYRRRDGRTVWVEFRSTLVDVHDLPGTTALAQMVDVTERHEADRRRAQQAAVAEVVSEVTTGVLAGQPLAQTYQLVVDGVARVFGAENVTLGFPDPRTGSFSVAAALGPVSTALLRGDLPVNQAFVHRLVQQGQTAFSEPPSDLSDRVRSLIGPGAAARFPSDPGGVGLVTAARARGAEPFVDDEVDMLAGLVRQLALAIELGKARADQVKLALLEERQRIARNLHDTVIQDLIAVGMQIDSGSRRDRDAAARTENAAVILDQLEGAVRRLRGAVSALSGPPLRATLGETVHAVVADAARVLGHAPAATITGPVDDLPERVGDHLVAVLREALSNISRHARATATTVVLTVRTGEVSLIVEDDGLGIAGGAGPGNGLANIRHRAEELGGHATIAPRIPTGTRLCWTAPLPMQGDA